MRSTTILVAALATVVTSVAAVEPAARPRIYFPRHVKRQFTNTTSSASDESASVTGVGVPLAQESDLTGLLGTLLGGKSSSSTSSSSSSSASASKTALTNDANDSKVTTIIIASTIVVQPKPSSTDPPASSTGSSEDIETFPASPLPSSSSNATSDDVAPTGSLPPLIVLPTLRSKTTTPLPTPTANSTASADSSEPVSSEATTLSSSSTSSGILLAPTGVVSSSSTSEGLLGGIGGLLSTIVSEVTDPKTANNTNTVDPTSTAPTATDDPVITIPLTILPGTGSSATPTGTPPPDTTIPPPVTNATETVPPTVTVPPTGPTSVPDVNTTITEPPTSYPPPVTSLPTTIVTIAPNSTSVNSTIPTPPPSSDSVVTSTTPTTTLVVTQPWLPTTIVVDPTPTTTTTPGLAPTSAVTLPTALPKAITPDSANDPPPEDTTLIQVGFAFGMNYPFVVSNSKAAAQIFQLLPAALSYAGGFPMEKVQMRKLIPLNTQQSLGYVTTLAIITYPSNMVEALRMDVRIPGSPLYNSPEQLVYNLTQQINSGIDIILGSYPEDGSYPGTGDGDSYSTSTSVPNADPFDNDDDSSNSSSSQKGATAGIALGVVGVAAAYGAAMFVIARRYKRKKQAHRRASSISDSSGMRTVGSPALMGGALLSRDFSSYGGVAGGRDSQGSGTGSGRSGGNSARTAVISAPMAAENSLGWN